MLVGEARSPLPRARRPRSCAPPLVHRPSRRSCPVHGGRGRREASPGGRGECRAGWTRQRRLGRLDALQQAAEQHRQYQPRSRTKPESSLRARAGDDVPGTGTWPERMHSLRPRRGLTALLEFKLQQSSPAAGCFHGTPRSERVESRTNFLHICSPLFLPSPGRPSLRCACGERAAGRPEEPRLGRPGRDVRRCKERCQPSPPMRTSSRRPSCRRSPPTRSPELPSGHLRAAQGAHAAVNADARVRPTPPAGPSSRASAGDGWLGDLTPPSALGRYTASSWPRLAHEIHLLLRTRAGRQKVRQDRV